MKIAIILPFFPPAVKFGTEIQTSNIAKHLIKKAHKVTVYTKWFKGLKTEEKKDGYKIVRIKYPKIPTYALDYLSFTLHAFLRIRKDRHEIDATQCMFLVPSGLIGCLLRMFYKIPTFAWIRGGDWFFARKHLAGRIANWFVFKTSTQVVVENQPIADIVNKVFKNYKLEIVGNGVDIDKRVAKGDKVVYVGQLIWRKGVINLIKAMNNIPEAECWLIGDGEDEEMLKKEAGKNIKFIGKIPPNKVKDYLMKARVFVLPSIAGEGLPNTLLEAMSLGIPQVSTSISGIPSVVDHAKTGYIVGPGKPKELEKHIRKLIKDDKLHSRMSKACLEKAKRCYSWDVLIRNLENLFKKVIKKDKR